MLCHVERKIEHCASTVSYKTIKHSFKFHNYYLFSKSFSFPQWCKNLWIMNIIFQMYLEWLIPLYFSSHVCCCRDLDISSAEKKKFEKYIKMHKHIKCEKHIKHVRIAVIRVLCNVLHIFIGNWHIRMWKYFNMADLKLCFISEWNTFNLMVEHY